jgi:putative transposase
MRFELRTYALTAVCFERKRIFQRVALAELMIATLIRYRAQGRFLLHGFVVMPDHLHVLITTKDAIEKSAQLIKGGFSFAARTHLPGEIWQAGYYDHRIRDTEDYMQQLAYITRNPVKRGLLDYPHTHINHADIIDEAPTFNAY